MYESKLLFCYNCKTAILNLSEFELIKLNGLSFQCECCGHQNTLIESELSESPKNDPHLNTFSINNIV